jgi:hypothetical protein
MSVLLVGSGIGPPDSEESDEAPRRTGRAQLRHPVPLMMVSPPRLFTRLCCHPSSSSGLDDVATSNPINRCPSSLLAMADSSSLALAFVSPGRPLRLFSEETGGSPSFPRVPSLLRLLYDPGSPARLTFNGAWARPPPLSTTKAPTNVTCFRGSITRLHSLLPTLEGGLSAYQPRVASGDPVRSFRVGFKPTGSR